MPLPIRVLIADHSPVILEGLRSVLQRTPDIQVAGAAGNRVEILDRAVQVDPDVILIDPNLPKVEALTVLRSLKTRAPRSKVILFAPDRNEDEFVAVIKCGCSGILLKDAGPALIEKSIQKVHAGEIWLDSQTMATIIRQLAHPPETRSAHRNGKASRSAELTRRERRVAALVAHGYKNKQIAEAMFVGEQTVKNHVHNIFEKLGISDRLELALYAIHYGLHLEAGTD